jgi:hypothetical protein
LNVAGAALVKPSEGLRWVAGAGQRSGPASDAHPIFGDGLARVGVQCYPLELAFARPASNALPVTASPGLEIVRRARRRPPSVTAREAPSR